MSRYIVAEIGEIPPGGRKKVSVLGRDIALFRIGDEYHAIQDRCPHEGASLCAGRLGGLAVSDRPGTYSLQRKGELLRCPWHGWEFDIRTGQSWTDPQRIRVRSFQTSVEPGSAVADTARSVKGPYVADTFSIAVERDYILVDLGPPAWIDAVIRRRITQAADIVEFEIERADGSALLPFEAGAHIDVRLASGLVRQYSLCGDPRDHQRYRIGVLREAMSRGGSVALHDTMHEGAPVQIGAPRTNFRLAPASAHTILIAGGIGITPLMSMAYALGNADQPYELHYLVRSQARAAFLEELRLGPVAPHLHLHVGDGSEPRFDIAACLDARPDADVYACGPARLLDDVATTHRLLGLPPSRLHTERFKADVEKGGAAFTIEAIRSGITVEVPENQSAAEALAEHGIAVNLSCEQGVCGTCLVAVLDGEPDHRDSYQNQEEKAGNRQMAICCSRARTPRLVLDV